MIKKIHVPDQAADNTFQLRQDESGCCGDDLATCKYVATFADGEVTALVVVDRDGTNKTLTFAAGATGPAAIKAAIEAVFGIEFYEDDGDPLIPGIAVVDNGATITITIIGEVEIVSVTHAGGSQAFTQTCTQIGVCDFEYPGAGYPGASGDTLRVNGVDDTLGDLTHATASAADVKSALEGAANWPANAVATVTKGASTFTISVSTESSDSIYLGGVATTDLIRLELVAGSCSPDWV